jgi:hypothetical protein
MACYRDSFTFFFYHLYHRSTALTWPWLHSPIGAIEAENLNIQSDVCYWLLWNGRDTLTFPIIFFCVFLLYWKYCFRALYIYSFYLILNIWSLVCWIMPIVGITKTVYIGQKIHSQANHSVVVPLFCSMPHLMFPLWAVPMYCISLTFVNTIF